MRRPTLSQVRGFRKVIPPYRPGTGKSRQFDAGRRRAKIGGEAGIRTLDTAFGPYNGLANRRLQPLGHLTLRLARDHGLAQGEHRSLADRRFSIAPYEIAF